MGATKDSSARYVLMADDVPKKSKMMRFGTLAGTQRGSHLRVCVSTQRFKICVQRKKKLRKKRGGNFLEFVTSLFGNKCLILPLLFVPLTSDESSPSHLFTSSSFASPEKKFLSTKKKMPRLLTARHKRVPYSLAMTLAGKKERKFEIMSKSVQPLALLCLWGASDSRVGN